MPEVYLVKCQKLKLNKCQTQNIDLHGLKETWLDETTESLVSNSWLYFH